jgi:hypothetical protein
MGKRLPYDAFARQSETTFLSENMATLGAGKAI